MSAIGGSPAAAPYEHLDSLLRLRADDGVCHPERGSVYRAEAFQWASAAERERSGA